MIGPIIIVGLGLIGGSLAAACRRVFPRTRIIGVTRNSRALAKAKKQEWIHEGYRNIESAFSKGGVPLPLVVLCTPVNTLKDFLIRLDRLAPPGTVVTDTGSVKGFLVRWSDRKDWKRIQFVGAHPMAGSHEQGIDAARPHLFDRALTFVTPGRGVNRSALQLTSDFWRRISRQILVVSPDKHDRLAAEISHLPHLVATSLVESVSPEALRVAASGFFDTTRVAQGDPRLWMPIVSENRLEIGHSLQRFEARLRRLRQALRRGDFRAVKKSLQGARKRRLALELKSL